MTGGWPFGDLLRGYYGAIYADPPWRFEVWAETGDAAHGVPPYERLTFDEIGALPVATLAAPDCVVFMWVCWPSLLEALKVIEAWGFTYIDLRLCVERLVAGPYLELFARTTRPGWDSWGNQTDKFAPRHKPQQIEMFTP